MLHDHSSASTHLSDFLCYLPVPCPLSSNAQPTLLPKGPWIPWSFSWKCPSPHLSSTWLVFPWSICSNITISLKPFPHLDWNLLHDFYFFFFLVFFFFIAPIIRHALLLIYLFLSIFPNLNVSSKKVGIFVRFTPVSPVPSTVTCT